MKEHNSNEESDMGKNAIKWLIRNDSPLTNFYHIALVVTAFTPFFFMAYLIIQFFTS